MFNSRSKQLQEPNDSQDEAQFRAIFELAPNAIMILDDDGYFVNANPAACKVYGMEKSEIIGRQFTDFVVSEKRRSNHDDWISFKNEKKITGKFELLKPNGEIRILSYTSFSHFVPHRHLSIFKDVTEEGKFTEEREHYLKIAEMDLVSLKKERELREDFVSMLTHDLRNPLSAASVCAQMIKRFPEQHEKHIYLAGKIVANLERADRMIRDLLDANRIKAGQLIPIDIQSCQFNIIIEQAIEELALIHGSRFEFKASHEVNGQVDPAALRRIIENLASNAVKYGCPDTKITISLKQIPGAIIIEVHNQGPEIPASEQSKIFHPFLRAQTTDAARIRGWGLGLPLVKGLMESHHGNVSVESSKNSGTTFRLVFPQGKS